MKSKKTIVAAAAGVVALGAGLGVAGLASADPTPSTPTSSPSASPSGTPGAGPNGRGFGRGDGRGGHGAGREAIAAELATKLGIDEAKVTDALKAIREENKPTAAPTPGATPTPGQTKPDPAAKDAELAKALAAKLGIDEAKVKTALDEIRTAHQADRAAALKTRLDAAVKAGTLTQAEADAVTKAVEKGVVNAGGR